MSSGKTLAMKTVKRFIHIIGNGNTMEQSFKKPDFSKGSLEFRVIGDEICIYGNSEGLAWLAQKCLALVDAGKSDHLHLPDYEVLTKTSCQATLAMFRE